MDLDRQRTAFVDREQGPATVRRFDAPDRVMVLDEGRLEVITVDGRTIGRGSYGPGWRWSQVARPAGRGERPPDHVGVVLSGRAKVRVGEAEEVDLLPGDFFHIATEFESWVVGHRPCEVLYINGVESLITRLRRPG
jgi:hypothetical protein